MGEFHEIGGYEVLSTLGKGARSTIFSVRDPRDSNVYALKRVRKEGPSDQRFIDQALRDHEIASTLRHENLRHSYKLIKQRDFIRVSEVLILMELVEGMTLEKHQPENLASLIDICKQVTAGLGAMHARSYVHLDIKPNNIMVTKSGLVKIIDFGQSCMAGTVKERIQGTPDYIAPEQVKRRTLTAQTDVFNLGATMYWLLTGQHVPTMIPKNQSGTNLRMEKGRVPPIEINPQTPPALSSLVMDCVATKPRNRPSTMQQVRNRLEIAEAQLARNSDSLEESRRRSAS